MEALKWLKCWWVYDTFKQFLNTIGPFTVEMRTDLEFILCEKAIEPLGQKFKFHIFGLENLFVWKESIRLHVQER